MVAQRFWKLAFFMGADNGVFVEVLAYHSELSCFGGIIWPKTASKLVTPALQLLDH